MLRASILATRKLLVPRPLPVYTTTLDAASCSSSVNYEVRRNNQSLLPLTSDYHGRFLLDQNKVIIGNVRWASVKTDFQVPDPSVIACNMINMLKCVDLAHLKDAPEPAFWMAVATGGSQILIPLLELVGGYSQTLTILQLHLAALTVASLGGVKWGLAISKNPVPTPNWDTMKRAIGPTGLALLGLTLPYPLGFLTVAGASVSSLYLDLKSCAYPPWGNAVSLYLTLTTLTGLFLALSAYLLFHNKENEKKKEEKKKLEEPKSKTNTEEEEDEDKPKKNGKNK